MEQVRSGSPGIKLQSDKFAAMSPLGTPMSMASTEAPAGGMSPFFFPAKFSRQFSNGSTRVSEDAEEEDQPEEMYLDSFSFSSEPSLQSELGQEAQAEVEAETRSQPSLQSKLGQEAQAEVEAETRSQHVLSFGLPPLQSKLGRRAQAEVEAFSEVLSFGLPPLQSKLGWRAQAEVEAQEWLQEQLNERRRAEGPQQYLVDGSEGLSACTDGLAFRRSKSLWDRDYEVAGPAWGETVWGSLDAEGWLQIEEGRFLPVVVDGFVALRCVESDLDDFDGGVSVQATGSSDESSKDASGNIRAFGLPALQSRLGWQAQAEVEAEEWLQKQLNARRQAAGPKQYLVDGDALRACTEGLAFRRSKNLWDTDYEAYETSGLPWGSIVSGISHADGWLQVDDVRFLPMTVDGYTVLRRVDPLVDGPALTLEGCVLDLEEGSPMFFSHDRSTSSGFERAQTLKSYHRLAMAQKRAEANVEACTIDDVGVIHGDVPASGYAQAWSSTRAERAKLFHRKRQARISGEHKHIDSTVLCANPGGSVFLYLASLGNDEQKFRKQWRRSSIREEMQRQASFSGDAWAVDSDGVVEA